MTNEELRARGCKIMVTHERFFVPVDNRVRIQDIAMPAQFVRGSRRKPWPKGGITTVRIVLPDGEVVRGTAFCSPKDNFSRKLGHVIALGRAVTMLPKGVLNASPSAS